MRIDRLKLVNFRGFEEFVTDFHPNFNVIIGINGAGKTGVLEGICTALGSVFVSDHSVQEDDIRVVSYEYSTESQFPVKVEFHGQIQDRSLNWSKTLAGRNRRTTLENMKPLTALLDKIQKNIMAGKPDNLPLIVFYPAERFWKERDSPHEKADIQTLPKGSRLRGYDHWLNPDSGNRVFIKWFRTQELSALQHQKDSPELGVVRNAVSNCISGCENIFFDVREDALMVKFRDKRILPFDLLSHGVRNMLSTVGDIAFRCVMLNPHLEENAAIRTSGIVLIDEIDLHLHPTWQRKVIRDIRNTFPRIQFIATTHSPMILSSTAEKVITIENGRSYRTGHTYGRDVNSLLNQVMDTEERPEIVQEALTHYFDLIQTGKGMSQEGLKVRKQLEDMVGADDPDLARADVSIAFFGEGP